MKSKKVPELMEWLESNVRIIDQPRDFGRQEVIEMVEIAEIEMSGDEDLLEQKIKEVKREH
jgi:hypothetical protein